MYAAMPEARCDIRKGRTVVSDCLAGSIGQENEATELGVSKSVDLDIYIKTSSLPVRGINIGDVVDVRQPEATGKWQSFRVSGITITGGVSTLSMAAKHE